MKLNTFCWKILLHLPCKLRTLWRGHAIVNTGGEVLVTHVFRQNICLWYMPTLTVHVFVRSGRFMRLKQTLKIKFSNFSLHVSFAEYTENCHWHVEGVDVAVN